MIGEQDIEDLIAILDRMAVWFRLVDEVLVTADKRAYQAAVR